MELSFLQNELVQALCWTLLHSIWQGVLLAVVTGLVMLLTRKSHARKRYSILTVLFFVFIAVAVVTFCRQISIAGNTSQTVAASLTSVDINNIIITDIQVSGEITSQPTFLERFTAYFNANASLVVMIWFIIFFAKFLRLSANLVYVQRLKSYKVHEPSEKWKEKLAVLVHKLGVTKKVKLIESGIVKVPLTMGMLKPVILLPLGLLSNLPADEIEAILLHELAHIRRRDYFVNLLQSIAETIFFFNPALLWLSSVIRDERENCCDDLAISVTNNKTNFINALISFQEYHLAKPGYGMAFPGSRNQLLNRVKRIVSNSNKTLNAAEKSVLSLGLAMFALFFFVAAKTVAPVKDKQDQVENTNTIKSGAASSVATGKPIMLQDAGFVQGLGTLDTLPSLLSKKDTSLTLKNLSGIEFYRDTAYTKDFFSDLPGLDMLRDTTDLAYLFNAKYPGFEGKMNMDEIRKLWSELTPGKWNFPADKSNAFFKADPFSDIVFGKPGGWNPTKDTLPSFKNFSSDITEDDNTRTVKLTATTTAGRQVYFKKVNGILQELSINGKKIEAADFDKYKEDITMLEEAEERKRVLNKIKRDHEKIKRDHERDLRQHEKEKQKENRKHELDKIQHDKMDSARHLFKKDRDKLFEKHQRDLFDKNKAKVDKSIALASKIKPGNPLASKADLALKDAKADLKPIRNEVKLDAKRSKLENLKPIDLKLKPVQKEKETGKLPEEKPAPENTFLKVDSTGKVTWAPPSGSGTFSDLRRKRVSADKPGPAKQEALKVMQQEDAERRSVSITVMKNIVQDLQKENITVDLQKSWFALDKEKFIVDGKPMPEEMHERFRQKYIKGSDGMGWYYGPAKLTGRGVFLDKKDLQAK